MIDTLNLTKPSRIGKGNECFYCGSHCKTTLDHFYPKSLGGYLKVYSCGWCNSEKKDFTPIEWINYLDTLLLRCNKDEGCNHGAFIRTLCFLDCYEKRKIERMRDATKKLWGRTKWSINKEYYLNNRRDLCPSTS